MAPPAESNPLIRRKASTARHYHNPFNVIIVPIHHLHSTSAQITQHALEKMVGDAYPTRLRTERTSPSKFLTGWCVGRTLR